MSKMNLMVSINAYLDNNPTNHPSKNINKYISDLQGIDISNPVSSSISLSSGQTLPLFSGEVLLSDDNTSSYDLNLKTGTTNTYILSHNTGTEPEFRISRDIGSDATSEITITKNGTILIFSFTSGPMLSLNTVEVGDEVIIGSLFSTNNQGKFKILSVIAGQFTVENANGQAEGPILLGIEYINQISIQGIDGVQIGDKIKISLNFSPVSFGTYEITDVRSNYIEFYSIKALPSESNIMSDLQIFNNSKRFLFVESDKKISVLIDGLDNGTIEPFAIGTALKPGMFLKNSNMYSASVKNESQETALIYYISAE